MWFEWVCACAHAYGRLFQTGMEEEDPKRAYAAYARAGELMVRVHALSLPMWRFDRVPMAECSPRHVHALCVLARARMLECIVEGGLESPEGKWRALAMSHHEMLVHLAHVVSCDFFETLEPECRLHASLLLRTQAEMHAESGELGEAIALMQRLATLDDRTSDAVVRPRMRALLDTHAERLTRMEMDNRVLHHRPVPAALPALVPPKSSVVIRPYRFDDPAQGRVHKTLRTEVQDAERI